MRKLLIAATICVLAATNLASPSQAHAASRHAHRASAGMSMKSVMSGLMSSGMMSEISGIVPGGIDGIPGAGSAATRTPASIGTLSGSGLGGFGGFGGTPSF